MSRMRLAMSCLQFLHGSALPAVFRGEAGDLDGSRWLVARHPTQRNRKQPFLTDHVELGRAFREEFTSGLRRWVRSGKLKLDGPWAQLRDPGELEAWLDELKACDWNVFIEGPPCGRSGPVTVLKYLARYLTGGPISDRRMIRDEDGRVWFWARGKDKQQGNPPRPFPLPGKEFVRRWAMHILPKGYTRARQFGGYHGSKRTSYLARCRELLSSSEPAAGAAALLIRLHASPPAALGSRPVRVI